jgi:stalled ribosome rescue protein Dom34
MSAHVVWIDSQEAKVFSLKPGKVDTQVLKAHHSDGSHSKENKESHENKFFHGVAKVLGGATEVLIVGPGDAKTHFKRHIDTHHHAELAKHIVGVEPMDHPTDNQILAHARKFFKARDLFEGI